MKTKQPITLLCYLLLLIALLLPFVTSFGMTVGAEAPSEPLALDFVLTAGEGSSVVMAETGDEITVSFILRRTDSDEGYATSGFQNYIHYDLSFFELVEDSILCYDTGNATAKKQTSLTHGEILQCQSMGSAYEARMVFCSFRLRVIGDGGSGMVYNSEVYAFDGEHRAVSVRKQPLHVLIDSGCTHASKTPVEAKTATCLEEGWEAYCDCDGCDAVFDASGERMIAGVPYTDRAHLFAETLTVNTLGHWYECTACGERAEYAAHIGGEATCTRKAACDVCQTEYGSLRSDNHKGETVIENQKTPWFLGDGYTGDVFCADCGELIEEGEEIQMAPLAEWPGVVWAIVLIAAILGILLFVRLFDSFE